ncbi:MAG: branched-chain amino acid ABC transporter substrate-binding protein [Bacteroidetes bacterium]|nr:branched-chain amino acid ABC transporter substrate-binding protein [Bacteroidota bacterium]
MKYSSLQVGVCGPFSGLAALLGKEMKQAIELAAREKNSTGGLAGHEIEIIARDDESDVRKAATVANELCGNAKLLGVIGHYSSDTSLAAARIYEKADLPLVAPIASNPLLTESGIKGIFRYTNRDDKTAKAISDYLYHERGKRKAILAMTDTAYGNSMGSAFQKAFSAIDGIILKTISFQQGEKDLSHHLRRLPADFDLLFYGGSFEGAPLLRNLRASGFDQLMATGDGCWDKANFLYPADDNLEKGEGVVVLSASSAVGEVAGSEKFSADYTQTYGEIVNYALNSYDCANLLFRAIENAVLAKPGSVPDRDSVRESLWSLRARGIANRNITVWDEKGDNQGAITRLYTARKGQFVAISQG